MFVRLCESFKALAIASAPAAPMWFRLRLMLVRLGASCKALAIASAPVAPISFLLRLMLVRLGESFKALAIASAPAASILLWIRSRVHISGSALILCITHSIKLPLTATSYLITEPSFLDNVAIVILLFAPFQNANATLA